MEITGDHVKQKTSRWELLDVKIQCRPSRWGLMETRLNRNPLDGDYWTSKFNIDPPDGDYFILHSIGYKPSREALLGFGFNTNSRKSLYWEGYWEPHSKRITKRSRFTRDTSEGASGDLLSMQRPPEEDYWRSRLSRTLPPSGCWRNPV
jgi:hypothetical protein